MTRVRHLTLVLAALAMTSCRNPFDPSADLKLLRFFGNGGLIVLINQVDAKNDIDYSNGSPVQNTSVEIANYSTVAAQITSYSVVYRQLTLQPSPVNLPPGSPIPTLGGAAGRRFNSIIHIPALADNTTAAGFNTTTLSPRIITREFLEYVGTGGLGASTIGGGIDCEIIFYGEDHNGHEVKLSGVLHVEID